MQQKSKGYKLLQVCSRMFFLLSKCVACWLTPGDKVPRMCLLLNARCWLTPNAVSHTLTHTAMPAQSTDPCYREPELHHPQPEWSPSGNICMLPWMWYEQKTADEHNKMDEQANRYLKMYNSPSTPATLPMFKSKYSPIWVDSESESE